MAVPTRSARAERSDAAGETGQPASGQGDGPGPDGGHPAAGWRAIGRWAWTAHLASLAIGGLYLLKLDHRMWFFFDEWDFIGSRGLSHAALGLLAPHNEHWVTLPILAYRALLSVFGLHHYWVFAALLIAAHLAVCHVLWRLSMRAGARPLVATVAAGIYVLFGAGSQNLVWAFQISFVGSVLFGLLWLWITDHGGPLRRRDLAGWAAGIAALMCSAIGVPMLMVTAVAVALRRGVRQAAAVVSVPLAAFAAWYALYGRGHRATPVTGATLLRIGAYTWDGISASLSGAAGVAGTGAVLGAGLLYGLLRRPSGPERRDAIARAGAAGAVLSYMFIAVGRAGLGTADAATSRYIYVAIALLLPAAALLLSELFRPAAGPMLVFGLLAALVLTANVSALRAGAAREIAKATWARPQIMASYDVANGPGYTFPGRATALYNGPQPTVANLRQFRRSGWLRPHYQENPGLMLGTRARLQVGTLPPDAVPPATAPAQISGTRALTVTASGPGCIVAVPRSARSQLILGPSRLPLLLTLTRDAPWRLKGELGQPDGPLTRSLSRLTMEPASRLLIGAPGVRTELRLPAGPTRVCGLSPASAAAAARGARPPAGPGTGTGTATGTGTGRP